MIKPTDTISLHAVADLCQIVIDNPLLKDGVFRAAATRLGKRLEQALEAKELPVLTADEVELAANMAEAVVQAIVGRSPRISSDLVLMRVCERVIVPITDALGYQGDAQAVRP